MRFRLLISEEKPQPLRGRVIVIEVLTFILRGGVFGTAEQKQGAKTTRAIVATQIAEPGESSIMQMVRLFQQK